MNGVFCFSEKNSRIRGKISPSGLSLKHKGLDTQESIASKENIDFDASNESKCQCTRVREKVHMKT